MNGRTRVINFIVLLTALLVSAVMVRAGESSRAPAQNGAAALADLGRLVGGEWRAPDSPYYHVFEWGVPNQTIIGHTYSVADDGLSSEARWFWHPREEVLRGYAIDATGTFFAEMTTRFDGEVMINDLETFAPDGAVGHYTGEWTFPSANSYDWVLFLNVDGSRERQMGLTFSRR